MSDPGDERPRDERPGDLPARDDPWARRQARAVACGFFLPLDVQLARLVAPADSLVALVLASVCRAVRQGHSCLPLSVLAGSSIVDEESEEVVFTFPDRAALMTALKDVPGVTVVPATSNSAEQPASEPRTPFVLEVAGGRSGEPGAVERLFTLRMFLHERALARGLAQLMHDSVRARLAPDVARSAWLTERLDHFFPPTSDDGAFDWQREAARHALSSRLSVISGGPGTGKTSTVVKLLCLLVEAAERAEGRPLRVLLVAPTGKAAARMTESIRGALGRLEVADSVARVVDTRASTLHRALGVRPDSRTRFRHGLRAPLHADVVLVDEASMVDLALMRSLVDALPPGCQLVLLGDRHQLASVEAGSVLSELCAALEGRAVTELTKSYRFSGASGIAALARGLREGQVEEVERLVTAPPADLRFHASDQPPTGLRELEAAVVEGYRDALRAGSAVEALDKMARFRVLCAHRRGDAGVEELNVQCRRWLTRAGLLPLGGEHYRGRLLLVTENDEALDLRNGDVGIVWPDARHSSSRGPVRGLAAYFPSSEGEPRRLSLAQLPAFETAFAMTIHKSQGSEYDDVAVVLPPAHSPLLSRELVYTAVTRARSRVQLFGPLASLTEATRAQVLRHSGLADQLSRLL